MAVVGVVVTIILTTAGVSIVDGTLVAVPAAVVVTAAGVVVAIVTESWGTSSGMSMKLGGWATGFGILSNKVFMVPMAEIPVISGVVRVGVIAEAAVGGAWAGR